MTRDEIFLMLDDINRGGKEPDAALMAEQLYRTSGMSPNACRAAVNSWMEERSRVGQVAA